VKEIRQMITKGRRVVRVGIIDDHAIVRAGIRMLIESECGIEVACEAPSASAAIALARNHTLDVILLDLSLRGENGLDFLPRLVRAFSPARILVLTAVEEVETHLLALEAGARGVVKKDQAPEILVKAIHAVNSGASWIGDTLSAAAVEKLAKRHLVQSVDPETAKIATLTPREREVVEVVARGCNGARIAAALKISDATVRHHTTSILGKLDLSSKLELAVYAIHHGLAGGQRAD
jgi:two-component system, NarL family, nitrate/nitrite response regulator NarL